MADPMTQSHQISSSQGLNDGHAKESKFSDSFFSSSPVSLIQSPQDKRVALDSEKSSEGVPTSLRFSSQPSSFSPTTFGNDNSISSTGTKDRSFQEKRDLFESSLGSQKQDSSPIKISPVSERIRALEALAAKQGDSDWSDAGFPHFRERHYEKSHSEIHGITLRSSIKKRPASSDQDSPESPFEILGDTRRGSDFEDTADWMRAHLPPAPNFNIGDFDEMKESPIMPESLIGEAKSKGAEVQGIPSSFVGVPDEFMDTPVEVPQQANEDSSQSKQNAVDDESEFDLRFLPTAYMWDKQEKPDMDTQEPPVLAETQDSEITTPAAPPPRFDTPSQETPVPVLHSGTGAKQQPATRGVDSKGVEILDADSSGESDDTVIEDASGVGNNDAAECRFPPAKQAIPNQQEKQTMQVPIINVIETEEQVLSDYEVEQDEEEGDEQRYPFTKDPEAEARQSPEELPDVSRSEFEEAAPKVDDIPTQEDIADSDGEHSPKHMVITDDKGIDQTSHPAPSQSSDEFLTQPAVPQNTEETSRDSFSNVIPDKTAETVPDLSPNYEDLSNDFESNDIDTYLDHYTSEELALKDQLNSGVFAVNNAETNESLKSNALQNSLNNTKPDQRSYEETIDETVETEPEHFPDNIAADVPEEPPLAQNNLPSLALDDQCVGVEDKKTIIDSGNFSLAEEEDHMTRNEAELPPYQESPPAEFPSFHDDQSRIISDVISDFVNTDVTEGLLKSKDKTTPHDDIHTGISPETETAIEPEPADVPKSKPTLIFQMSTPEIQISEAPPNILDSIDESDQDEVIQCDAPDTQVSPEISSTAESESPPSAATDSFVEFMRECLKSQQDEESQSPGKESASVAPSSPATDLDLEQECLTISALKERESTRQDRDETGPPEDIPVSAKVSQLQSESLICPNPSLHYHPNEMQTDASLTKEIEAIDIWVAEAYHLAEHVLALILTHLTVHDLVYWRDPKKSGVVFGISLLLLLSLAAFSVISVVSYLLLALLCVTISFRIYKSVIQAVQKSGEGHPFKELMEKDVSLSPETFRKHVDVCLTYINRALKQLSRLFLVEDLVDSLKLAVVMWLLTYVGAVFNGITVLILVDILAFTVPPLYEKYKTQIDRYIEIVRTHVNTAVAKIQEKLPKAAKRSKAE